MLNRTILSLACISMGFMSMGQLVVTNTQTPQDLVQNVLLGAGITATNVTFNGGPGNLINDQIAEFNGVGSNLGLASGVVMATSSATGLVGANNVNGSTFAGPINPSLAGDPDLAQIIAPNAVMDPAVLEFDFVPTSDSLQFRFVFGSEEYPDYVCSFFNDVFGFFLSGPGIAGPFTNMATNIALIPGTAVPVSINTVNSGMVGSNGTATTCAMADPNWQSNSTYFVDNLNGPTNQLDGFTVVLTAEALVQCGQQYHIKIAVSDAVDGSLDSGVFLEAGSFSSLGSVSTNLSSGLGVVNDSILLESCAPVELNFVREGDTTGIDTIPLTIGGTATPGLDYMPPLPAQLIFQPGDTLITLPMMIPVDPDPDETITLSITQVNTCSGVLSTTDYTFYIQGPPPLAVTAIDGNNTCNQSALISATATGGFGFYNYSWSTGATTASTTVSPTVTTDYIVTVTDTCGLGPITDTSTITMPVYLPLQITMPNDTAIPCLTSVQLSPLAITGGDGNYSGSWFDTAGNQLSPTSILSVQAGNPTYYIFQVTDGCGSIATDSVQVSTAILPDIEITAPDTVVPVCVGDTITIGPVLITGGNGVYTYQWVNNGTVIATTQNIDVIVNSVQSYILTVDDQCGYSGMDTIVVSPPVYEPFTLEVHPDVLVCFGDSVRLFAHVDGGSGVYDIAWPNKVDSLGVPYSDPEWVVYPDQLTEYFPVLVKDACGLDSLADSTLIVTEFIETDIVVKRPGLDDIELFAASEPLGSTFTWDVGDGTRYRGSRAVHSYFRIDTTFLVSLVVTTVNGCVDTSYVLIEPPAQVFFPNAFTPDSDGNNDTWFPIGTGLDILQVTIFDRWGKQVFDSEAAGTFVWDGTVNGGEQAKPDVYVYWYKAAGLLLPVDEGFGHVTLVR